MISFLIACFQFLKEKNGDKSEDSLTIEITHSFFSRTEVNNLVPFVCHETFTFQCPFLAI